MPPSKPLNCFIQSILHFCQLTLCRKYFSKKIAQKWAEGKSAFKSDSWIIAALQGQEMKWVQAFHVLPVHNNSSKFIIHSNWGISVLGSRGAWIGKDGRMLTTVRSNKYSPQISNTKNKCQIQIKKKQVVQQIFPPTFDRAIAVKAASSSTSLISKIHISTSIIIFGDVWK